MAQTRMPSGKYQKKLLRLPPDILEILEEEALKEDRSLNGQLVHTLRKCLTPKQEPDERRALTPVS